MNDAIRWLPYCGEAPGPAVWLSRWNLDPVLGAVLLLLALALWHSPSTEPLAPSRRLSLRGAWWITLVLYVSPLCALSSAFFTVRVVHHIALVLAVAPLLASATAFWIAVRKAGPAAAMGAILVTTVLMGLLGALITFAGRPLYAPHFASTLSWGVSPLEDQQLAGIIMWAPGSIAYLAVAMWIGWRWLDAERARAALRAGPA